ncbi:integrase catalytic domain-containing protein [Trichonephila clavipes]|nr:integrase catalytic domain-containing protein [Trichonephila clavipes]
MEIKDTTFKRTFHTKILIKNSYPYDKVTMPIFCDASQSAYTACVFIRTEFENNISCELAQARDRVSPIKKMTIPLLELLSCTIGARLSKAKLTNPAEWRHISGPLNPAVLPSRGCNIENLRRSRWCEGPEWLKLPSTNWPQSDINPD